MSDTTRSSKNQHCPPKINFKKTILCLQLNKTIFQDDIDTYVVELLHHRIEFEQRIAKHCNRLFITGSLLVEALLNLTLYLHEYASNCIEIDQLVDWIYYVSNHVTRTDLWDTAYSPIRETLEFRIIEVVSSSSVGILKERPNKSKATIGELIAKLKIDSRSIYSQNKRCNRILDRASYIFIRQLDYRGDDINRPAGYPWDWWSIWVTGSLQVIVGVLVFAVVFIAIPNCLYVAINHILSTNSPNADSALIETIDSSHDEGDSPSESPISTLQTPAIYTSFSSDCIGDDYESDALQPIIDESEPYCGIWVSVSDFCANENHVGDEWSIHHYASFNGTDYVEVPSTGAWYAVDHPVTLYVKTSITDDDPSASDTGVNYHSMELNTDPNGLSSGSWWTIEQHTPVTENGGRYAGNTCTWDSSWTITFLYD